MKLENQTILITGATSGIGRAFAEAFYNAGNTVIACGRREERLYRLEQDFPGMYTYVCDVADASSRERLFHTIQTQHPQLNMVMLNAGVQYAFQFQHEMDMRKVDNEIQTNLMALIHFDSLFTPFLKDKKDATIIHISSGLAFAPLAFMPVYCATKAAVHSLSLSLRHQLKPLGIAVFEIAPPAVDTELGHDRREDKEASHGGIPISEFLSEAWQALEQDIYEAPISFAKNLHAGREKLFDQMNAGF